MFLSVCFCISSFLFFLCNLITPLVKILSCLDKHYSYLQDMKYCKLYISLNKYIAVVVVVVVVDKKSVYASFLSPEKISTSLVVFVF